MPRRPRRGGGAARRGRQRNAGSRLPASGPQRQIGVAAAYSSGQMSRAPLIMASRDSSRIVHRELVASLSTVATDFTINSRFAINPGLKASFPWLSTQAVGWQAYRFNSLRYCWYTRTSTQTVGSVMLIPEYDAADAAPGSESIASTYEDVAEDSPWKDIVCTFRTNAMDTIGPRHFVRTGPVPSGQDVKLFDVGQLFVATTDGSGANTGAGKVWVEYDVTFHTPQLPPDGVDGEAMELVAAGGGIAAASPFGAAPVVFNNGVFAAPGFYVNSNQLLFDSTQPGSADLEVGGVYLFEAFGTGTVISAASWTVGAGLNSKTVLFAGFPVAATSFACATTVTVTAPSALMTLALTATTITAVRVYVTRLNDSTLF